MKGKFEFDGAYYKEIGEFIGENYLNYGFTKGTEQEVVLMFGAAGFQVQNAYGCIAGRFSRKPLEPDDDEIMIVARRP